MEAQRHSCTPSLTSTLDLGVWSAPRTAALLQERDPLPIVEEAVWAPEAFWMGAENFLPTGI
jgi:hypothetical protein